MEVEIYFFDLFVALSNKACTILEGIAMFIAFEIEDKSGINEISIDRGIDI